MMSGPVGLKTGASENLFFADPYIRKHSFPVREAIILKTVASETMISEDGCIRKPLFLKTVTFESTVFKKGKPSF